MDDLSLDKVYSRTEDLFNDLKKEEPPEKCDFSDILKRYVKTDKYAQYYAMYPLIFHVLLYHRIYCKDALTKYLEEYYKERIESKERYMEVNKAYLIHFNKKILRSKNIQTKQFVEFYMGMMEELFKIAENSKTSKEELKELEDIRNKKNLDLLRKRLEYVK